MEERKGALPTTNLAPPSVFHMGRGVCEVAYVGRRKRVHFWRRKDGDGPPQYTSVVLYFASPQFDLEIAQC